MTKKHLVYTAFLLTTVGLFVLSTIGFGVHSRMTIGGDSYARALARHMHYALAQPTGSVLLLLPFLFLGWTAARFCTRKSVVYGIVVFLIGAVVLVVLYYNGYMGSEIALKNKKWTAAALSVGLLPFEGIGLVALLLIGGLIMGKPKEVKTET